MPSIEQIVAQIRTAIFGRDVRENIAEGIETCYTDVTNGVTVANTAANKITNMTVSATNGNQASATITEVDGHKHITFTLPKGDTGDAFHIVKTYASISAMNADYSSSSVHVGEYVMIVSNVEDPDNAKVYIKGSSAFNFVVDMSGSAGIQGQAAYVHIRYAAAQPTQDSDMKTTADNWMGIYSGTSSTAPSTYTSYIWFQIKGAKGDTGNTGPAGPQTYVHIRYSENEPTQDSDMKTTPDAWMGIYSGTSSTAPTTYNSYIWYNIKGSTGSVGPTGADAHVYIRYAAVQPTQDSDMKATADAWMGIYSGTASTAPTTYTSYTWYKIRGEDGAGVITTIEMNGQALPITSGVVDLGTVLTDSSAFVASQQSSSDAGKALGINDQGEVVPVPFSGNDFTGATASTAGTHGYVPAPAAGDQLKVLMGGGTWGQAPGARVYTKEITVTNSSGSYSQTFVDENITADMKAVELEYTRSYVFGDVITVTPANGSLTIACNDVAGTDTIKISLLKTVGDPSTVTSSEFDILANRIGTLSSLDTTAKTNIVAAVNEVKGAVDSIAKGTMRTVPFGIAVADWSGSGTFTASVTSAYITTTSVELTVFDSTLRSYAQADINVAKASGGGGAVFTTTTKPTGTITGTLIVWDNDDGKVPTLIEDTVVSIANGGTGQSTLAGAKTALGIDTLSDQVAPFTTSKTWDNFTKPTLSNGTHYGDGCNYLKIGCFVVVIISVQFDSPPSNALLWTMPSGYIPVGNVDISASGGASYNAKAQCVINSSGGVRVTSVDKWVTGYGIYVVAS